MANPLKPIPLERSRDRSSRRDATRDTKILTVLPDAPSRISGYGPISIIDIGSNSVRLVAYERLSRSPTPIFNEKALCGLGRGLAETGMLNDDAVESAIAAIHRFKAISEQLNCVELLVIATAAVREADNGDEFIERVTELTDVVPHVLSGQDEAHYAALGVVSGIYEPDGVVGDMGGGSLELVDVHHDTLGEGMTFALGGLRLKEEASDNVKEGLNISQKTLKGNSILEAGEGRTFYAVGGTWRALAHLYMNQNNYPLHVLHNYTVEPAEMDSFCKSLIRQELSEIKKIGVVSKSRAQLLQYGAAVLLAILEVMKPSAVVISVLGVREGFLYDQLKEADIAEDGLIAGARELSLLRSRSPDNAIELIDWTDNLFDALGLFETKQQQRLRETACLLADVGWRVHPDYRGEQSINTISHASLIGITHAGRAFVSLSAYFRHQGQLDENELPPVATLLENEDMRLRARLLGVAFRLAHLISASMEGVLPETGFEMDDQSLQFVISEDQAAHVGERMIRRLGQIGKLLDMETRIKVKDWR